MLSTAFITDSNGKKISSLLPIKQYQHLLEELEDIRVYDKAKARKESPSHVGDYRVFYEIHDGKLITTIGHRREVY